MEGYEHLIGGFFGGVASTMACHPLDLLKIRYSADEGSNVRPKYRSYLHAGKSIVEAKGYRGLYQGLSPNLVGSSISWALYFQIYHSIKKRCTRNSVSTGYEVVDNFFCGMIAGTSILAVTNPIWIAKTRLCLQYEAEKEQYRGLIDCWRSIVRKEGFWSLYKGFLPGMIGSAHGATQFMLYNYFKENRFRQLNLGSDQFLSTHDCLLYSAVSKVIATTITFPYQVLRTRMQDHHANYLGMRDLMRKTYKVEGIAGFYKGLMMGNLRQLPNVVVTFVIYENSRYIIRKFTH